MCFTPLTNGDDLPSGYERQVLAAMQRLCSTERAAYMAAKLAIRVGQGGIITRWAKDTVLTFTVTRKGFPNDTQYHFATDAVKVAAEMWNDLKLGITFKYLSQGQGAFQVVYRDNDAMHEDCLGSAFFPGDAPKRRKLKIYALAFQDYHALGMVNIFLHELGHILGLRHEFLEDDPSVLLGMKNPLSIMDYHEDWSQIEIHEEDARWTKIFYACADSHLAGLRIVDIDLS